MDLLAGLSVAHPQRRALPQLQQQQQQQQAQAEGAGGSEEGKDGDEFVSPSLLILGPPGVVSLPAFVAQQLRRALSY